MTTAGRTAESRSMRIGDICVPISDCCGCGRGRLRVLLAQPSPTCASPQRCDPARDHPRGRPGAHLSRLRACEAAAWICPGHRAPRLRHGQYEDAGVDGLRIRPPGRPVPLRRALPRRVPAQLERLPQECEIRRQKENIDDMGFIRALIGHSRRRMPSMPSGSTPSDTRTAVTWPSVWRWKRPTKSRQLRR